MQVNVRWWSVLLPVLTQSYMELGNPVEQGRGKKTSPPLLFVLSNTSLKLSKK